MRGLQAGQDARMHDLGLGCMRYWSIIFEDSRTIRNQRRLCLSPENHPRRALQIEASSYECAVIRTPTWRRPLGAERKRPRQDDMRLCEGHSESWARPDSRGHSPGDRSDRVPFRTDLSRTHAETRLMALCQPGEGMTWAWSDPRRRAPSPIK